ncbi:MAG: riboflavin kinase [Patescibacteria group bacterium]
MNHSPNIPLFTVSGIVSLGGQFARTLGYPTVNIPLGEHHFSGSFVGVVEYCGATYNAGLYADPERGILEAHLFGFTKDIYGEPVRVLVFKKIREKEAFANLEDLKLAIKNDMEFALQYNQKLTKIPK